MVATPDVGPTRKFDLKFNLLRQFDRQDCRADYDRFGDTLIVSFVREPRPTVGVVLGDYLLLRVDPRTEEVTGVEVEHFAKVAVFSYPAFAGLIPLVSIPEREVSRIQKRLSLPKNQEAEADPAAFKRGLMDVIRSHQGEGQFAGAFAM